MSRFHLAHHDKLQPDGSTHLVSPAPLLLPTPLFKNEKRRECFDLKFTFKADL